MGLRATALVGALLVFQQLAGVGSADSSWCEEDPVFVFDGKAVDVVTGFSDENVPKVKGAILFELELPVNAGPAVALGAALRVPQDVRISYTLPAYGGTGAIPVLVHVTVPADGDFATRTRITGTAEGLFFVDGWSNQRVTIPLRFLVG
jgi:hypothetical protein